MKTATYLSDSGPRVLQILKDNGDGTVELGDPSGGLVVGKCIIGDAPKIGQCTEGGELPKVPGSAAASAAVNPNDPAAVRRVVKP